MLQVSEHQMEALTEAQFCLFAARLIDLVAEKAPHRAAEYSVERMRVFIDFAIDRGIVMENDIEGLITLVLEDGEQALALSQIQALLADTETDGALKVFQISWALRESSVS